jgi:Ca-activated chloride channel family protein
MPRRAAAWAAAALAAWAAGAQAQTPTFRASVDLVRVGVTVVDRDGHPVTGLGPQDFGVEEDGRPQAIRYFAEGDAKGPAVAPIHLGLLLDTSESMADDIRFARTAVIKFLMAVPEAEDTTLVDFDTKVRVALYGPSDFPRLVERIRNRQPEGWTALYDAIGVYLDGASQQVGRTIMLLCTDGGDTRSAIDFAETIKLLQASDVTVYAIGLLGRGATSLRNQQRMALQRMADTTGGKAFFPSSVQDLDRVYPQILQEIHGQYSLGYISTNRKMDGSWRKLRIRVVKPGLSDVKIRARDGYYSLYMPPKGHGGTEE